MMCGPFMYNCHPCQRKGACRLMSCRGSSPPPPSRARSEHTVCRVCGRDKKKGKKKEAQSRVSQYQPVTAGMSWSSLGARMCGPLTDSLFAAPDIRS